MRALLITVLLFGSLGPVWADDAATVTNAIPATSASKTGRVLKVLTFLLDKNGQDSLSPSLFDRDAYQAQLREHSTNGFITGVRFDVQWKAVKAPGQKLKVRVEARGVAPDGTPAIKKFEADGTAGFFSHWTKFTLAGTDYKKFGAVVAWRATLWNGDELLGEQKSFLW